MKTSGIEAEHGGALGGVVNVVMKKGSNDYHGTLFGPMKPTRWMDPVPTCATIRWERHRATDVPGLTTAAQTYQAKKDHFRYRSARLYHRRPHHEGPYLVLLLGFAPLFKSRAGPWTSVRTSAIAYPGNPSQFGRIIALENSTLPRTDSSTYWTARIDAALTEKIRVFGSWLYQYGARTGATFRAQILTPSRRT